MAGWDRSLYRVQAKWVLSSTGMSVTISNVLNADGTESTTPASFTSASLVASNDRATKQEMMIGSASGWVLTITNRWLDQSDTITTVPANQIQRGAGTIIYVTKLGFNFALDFAQVTQNNNFSGNNTFSGSNTFSWSNTFTWASNAFTNLSVSTKFTWPSFASVAARNTAIPSPVDGMVCTVAGDLQHYNATTSQWETAGTTTPTPNGSETVAGKFQQSTDVAFIAGIDLWSTGAQNVAKNSQIKNALDNLVLNYGNGSDGNVTITTTVTLTKDMFYNNLTINVWGQLIPNWYKIFVKNTLINNATAGIQRNGNNGGNGNNNTGSTGGTGWVAATPLWQGTLNDIILSAAGWAGGTNSNNGVVGGAGVAANPSYSNISSTAGGTGSNSGTQTGGTGGALAASTRWSAYNIVYSGANLLSILSNPASAINLYTWQYKGLASGGGGWGWAADNGLGNGWGGGGGGWGNAGVIWIQARIFNNLGTITAIGWTWGNGWTWGWTWGGWAGGSGWIFYLIYSTITNLGTITLTGGAGGTGANVWGTGSTGTTISIQVT